MNKEKRKYNSTNRLLKTKKNRDTVLRVAKRLFETKGFKGTSLEEIARESSLAKPTLYATFKSKEGILLAIFDASLSQDTFENLVKEISLGSTAKERFEKTAKLCRELYEAESSHLNLLKSATVLSSELKNLEIKMEERRYLRQKKSIEQLKKKGLLRSDLSVKKARDIIWSFTGRDFYRLLVLERGWSLNEYESWLSQLLLETLS